VPNSPQEQEAGPPQRRQLPNVPPDIDAVSGQTRILVEAIEASLKDFKDDVREIKAHRHSDFVYFISVFPVCFILLAGMFIFGYFRLYDRIV
jgi:hypothetical protein